MILKEPENFNNYISKSKSNRQSKKAHYNIGNSYLTQYAKETKKEGQPSGEYLEKLLMNIKNHYDITQKITMQDIIYLMH